MYPIIFYHSDAMVSVTDIHINRTFGLNHRDWHSLLDSVKARDKTQTFVALERKRNVNKSKQERAGELIIDLKTWEVTLVIKAPKD